MPKSRGRKKQQRTKLAKLANEALQKQREAFRAKFGRDPRPGDPIFFDPDADQPTPMKVEKAQADAIAAMRQAGVRPQIIYAFQKTGLLVTEVTPLSPEQRREWEAAIEEYFEMERKAKGESD